MKKVLIGFLFLVLLTVPCFATQRVEELTDMTLTKTTTDTGWLQKFVGNAEKVTFFITLDSSSTTNAVTLAVTIQASADGENWTDIKWYDLAGGTTAQVNETLGENGDETYVMRLDDEYLMPHIRIKISNEGNWDTQTGAVTVNIVEDK